MSFTDAENTTFEAFPKPIHDHSQCVKDALAKALAICQARGVRFYRATETGFLNSCAPATSQSAPTIFSTPFKNVAGKPHRQPSTAPSNFC